MSVRRFTRWHVFVALLLLALCGCALLGRQEEKTPAEHQQQQQEKLDVSSPEDMNAHTPTVDVEKKGFENSQVGNAADDVFEGAVIVALAAGIAGAWWLFRQRRALFGFLLSFAALVLAALAFFNSAT